jgi:PKD repeat protein
MKKNIFILSVVILSIFFMLPGVSAYMYNPNNCIESGSTYGNTPQPELNSTRYYTDGSTSHYFHLHMHVGSPCLTTGAPYVGWWSCTDMTGGTCTAISGGYQGGVSADPFIDNPTQATHPPSNWLVQTTRPTYDAVFANNTFLWSMSKDYYDPVVAPVAAFSCSPTSQYPDTSVVCTDSSTNTPTDWYWTIDAESFGVDAWQTHTGQNFTWQSAYSGLFSVNLRANNSAGFDWENKSNYVSISENATPNNCYLPLATGYSRTKFRCMNPTNDATVFGCNQQLNDVEGGAWSNQSDLSDGIWCIDTLPLHHINAYGDATGYTSGSRIGVQEWNNMQYTIPLIPGYVPNATAGNVWVYVYVTDYSTYGPISGAQVSLSGNGLTTQSSLTGSSGGTSLQWPNSTVAYINVVKSGYTSGSKVITTSTTGPDIAYITLHTGTATSTLTPNPTPTGGPTALPTQDTRTASEKDIDMMNLIRDNGSALIGLAIITTMLGLMKMWGK